MVGNGRGRKAILKGGDGWILPAQVEQLKSGQSGERLLQNHLWCPSNILKL